MDAFIPFAELPWLVLAVASAIGLAGLYFGGNWLTDGAASMALLGKINPVIVGLTVVSVATSMPEMITSIISALKGSPGLALGNILGSNICNVGLILGIAALIWPFAVQSRLIFRDTPFLIAVTALFYGFSFGGLARWEGAVLLLVMVSYLGYLLRRKDAAAEAAEVMEETSHHGNTWPGAAFLVLLGGAGLALGADILVNSSVEMASRLGVSDVVIGITVVAIGTSLPELAASIAAALKHQTGILAGNIVGSNFFNIVLIGGGVSLLHPLEVEPQMLRFDYPAMLVLTVALWLIFLTGKRITRLEGGLLLLAYGLIIGFSVSGHLSAAG